MNQKAIKTDRAAIYLLDAKANFNVQVNRELIVVFSVPQLKVAGVAVFPVASTHKDMVPLLDTLLQKIQSDFKAAATQIRIKLFGLSEPHHHLTNTVQKWAKTNQLRVAVNETGGGVARNLMVESETGLVGVSYAEGIVASTPEWLSEGSSAQRKSSPPEADRVLVLSSSPVSRRLCKQAIEANEGWAAASPEKPLDLMVGPVESLNFYKAVIVFDDLGIGKPIEAFIKRTQAAAPEVPIGWAGSTKPAFTKSLLQFGTLKPQTQKKFKAQLVKMLIDPPSTGPLASVISFPHKKKKQA